MSIGDPTKPEEAFMKTADIAKKYGGKLSMGMSSDYEIAIKYGTDYVRIGTAIFGARDYKKLQ